MTDVAWLQELVRDVPDFPTPGILFKDVTPLLGDVDAFRFVVDALADDVQGDTIDKVIGIEARGFLLAAPIAYRLGAAIAGYSFLIELGFLEGRSRLGDDRIHALLAY